RGAAWKLERTGLPPYPGARRTAKFFGRRDLERLPCALDSRRPIVARPGVADGSSSAGRCPLALDLFFERGVALEKQVFDWHDMVRLTVSKLDDDAFTRLRVILMNGIENESWTFQHQMARMSDTLRLPLAKIRRIEQHQQTLVNWMLPADQSVLETTIGYEQVAVEVTASVAQNEPDAY